jgi:hypothetical protein
VTCFGQLAFDDHLRGDACMVGSGLPKRVKAAHAMPTHQNVLQRVVERVAHVQNAGDVGRRDHNAVCVIPRRVGACDKGLFRQPAVCNAGLGLVRVEFLFHWHGLGSLCLGVK